MSVRELKEELKAGGVNTSGMLEKEDLTTAVTTLRATAPSPPSISPLTSTSSSTGKGKTEEEGVACSHCGKHGAGLKSCARCRQVGYCGKE